MAGRSVLVTGCSDGGLGAELALEFHNKGYRVIATARNVNKMGQMKSNGIEMLTLDVQNGESIKKCVSDVSELLDGKLDILVNNAGAGYSMPIMDIEMEQIRNLFDLNVFSIISVSRAFLPLIRSSSNGVIVNNTSVAAIAGPPIQAAYNASKAAAAALTNNLRQELKPFGVQVVELKTGAVKTNFFANVGEANLPADSIYTPAKAEIQRFMEGGQLMDNAITARVWARRVVGDLSTATPASVIWRGTQATLVRFVTLFPLSWFDSIIMKMVGLDILAKRLKSQAQGVKRA